jgi:hypothetical protein
VHPRVKPAQKRVAVKGWASHGRKDHVKTAKARKALREAAHAHRQTVARDVRENGGNHCKTEPGGHN